MSAVPFIDLDILATQRNRFVVQHLSKGRPASIKNGFSHPCFCQLTGIDVSNDDSPVGLDKPCGLFVKKIFSRIGDFGMDRLSAFFVSRALRYGKSRFVFPEYARVLNLGTIGHRGKGFQAEVNTDLAECANILTGNLASEIDVPTSTRILGERSTLKDSFDVPAFPKAENALFITDRSIGDLNGAGNKWQPSEGFLSAIAGTLTDFVSGLRKLSTNISDCIAMQTKFGSRTSRELNKIDPRRPFSMPFEGVFLGVNAIIPNVRTCFGMAREIFCAFVLDSVLIRQYHKPTLIGLNGEVN